MYYTTLESILISITLLFAIANLKAMAGTFYCVIGCTLRWKENINLENSVKLSLERNLTTIILFVPVILVAAHYRLFNPCFSQGWSEFAMLALTSGALIFYTILRTVAKAFAKPRQMNRTQFEAASKSWANYFILCAAIILISSGICSFTDTPESVTKSVLLYETSAVFCLFIFRKWQILKNSCALLPTILYLCALEILPAAFLVSAAIFF